MMVVYYCTLVRYTSPNTYVDAPIYTNGQGKRSGTISGPQRKYTMRAEIGFGDNACCFIALKKKAAQT